MKTHHYWFALMIALFAVDAYLVFQFWFSVWTVVGAIMGIATLTILASGKTFKQE